MSAPPLINWLKKTCGLYVTSKQDKEIATTRYKAVAQERKQNDH